MYSLDSHDTIKSMILTSKPRGHFSSVCVWGGVGVVCGTSINWILKSQRRIKRDLSRYFLLKKGRPLCFITQNFNTNFK